MCGWRLQSLTRLVLGTAGLNRVGVVLALVCIMRLLVRRVSKTFMSPKNLFNLSVLSRMHVKAVLDLGPMPGLELARLGYQQFRQGGFQFGSSCVMVLDCHESRYVIISLSDPEPLGLEKSSKGARLGPLPLILMLVLMLITSTGTEVAESRAVTACSLSVHCAECNV
jgi:hypothetical protein